MTEKAKPPADMFGKMIVSIIELVILVLSILFSKQYAVGSYQYYIFVIITVIMCGALIFKFILKKEDKGFVE